MAVISLAVKYRPHKFEDVTEQGAIKDILSQQISTDTFQHAYLFIGPAGTGKTTCARIFSDEINEHMGNPIEVDAASNSGVDNVRQIIEDSRRNSLDSKYKIFIIDECHSLSSGAWQAFLKLLEEPPKSAIFIFCTTDPQKIPATIMSRVQRYQFNKISTSGIINRLRTICDIELYNDEDAVVRLEAIEYIARIANGGMRDAITMLDKCLSLSTELTIGNVIKALGTSDYDTYFNLLTSMCNYNSSEAIKIIESVYNDGKDLKVFVNDFQVFVVDVCKQLMTGDISLTQIPPVNEYLDRIEKYNVSSVLRVLDVFRSISNTIKWESNPRYVIETYIICCDKEK